MTHSDSADNVIENVDATCSAECGTTLSKILAGASNLKTLDLFWYSQRDEHLEDVWPDYYDTEQLTFGKCLRSLTSASLQKLSLAGIHTTATILCELLGSTSARDIKFEAVHIHQGAWTEVFAILTRSEDPFAEIYLDDLFDHIHGGLGMIFFDMRGNPKFPMTRGFKGPSTLHRRGAKVQTPIKWEHGSGRPVGSGRYQDWMHEHYGRFGPLSGRRRCRCEAHDATRRGGRPPLEE